MEKFKTTFKKEDLRSCVKACVFEKSLPNKKKNLKNNI